MFLVFSCAEFKKKKTTNRYPMDWYPKRFNNSKKTAPIVSDNDLCKLAVLKSKLQLQKILRKNQKLEEVNFKFFRSFRCKNRTNETIENDFQASGGIIFFSNISADLISSDHTSAPYVS